MITSLLIFIPLASAIITYFSGNNAKYVALISALGVLGLSLVAAIGFVPDATVQYATDISWIAAFNARFSVGMDGISLLLVLLTTVLVPLIILSAFSRKIPNAKGYYSLILWMQAGLIGVFTAQDAFLFYVSWEAALIPVYFLAAVWGGADRAKVTFKFFIYTIFGSLLMLIALIYVHLHTANNSFALVDFYNANLSASEQCWVFWGLFIAFAIKMPIFPFHTWQPDTYTESPTQATMLLSGIMLKMGIYGVIRWLLPIVPTGIMQNGPTAITLAVIGIVYASIIAFRQKDMKRLVAYSSIAHVGLIAAGVFALNEQGMQGAMVQMLSHGINVVGMFFVIDIISEKLKTRQITDLGGIVHKAPILAISFLIILLGTVALPLTNGFVGEFLLLLGVYQYNMVLSIFAGLTIILGAVYMLRMYKGVIYGSINDLTTTMTDVNLSEKMVLYLVILFVVSMGVYPQPFLHISEAAVQNILKLTYSRM